MVHLKSTRTAGLAIGLIMAASCSSSPHHSSSVSLTGPTAPRTQTTGATGGQATTTVAPSKGAAAPGPTTPPGQSAATTTPTIGSIQAAPAPAARPTGPAPVPPGTYHYAQIGSNTLKSPPGQSNTTSAPMSLPVPSDGTLVVGPASGGTQQWLRSALTPSTAPSATSVLFNASGVFTVSQTVNGSPCPFDSPVPWPPWPIAVGKTFTGHGSCSGTSFGVIGRVMSSGSTPVGGAQVATYLVHTTLSLNGSAIGIQDDSYAPSLRLPVKTHTVLTVNYLGYLLSSDITYTLKSVTPTA